MNIAQHIKEHIALGIAPSANVLTVGPGCNFTTVVDAIEYINAQTYIETLHTGSFTHVEGGKIITASAAISAGVAGKQLYLQTSTDDFLYPIEVTVPGTSTTMKPFYPMWGRTPGAIDFSIVAATKRWGILLSPGRHEGTGSPAIIPPFTSLIGYGKNVSIYEDEAADDTVLGRGIVEIPATSADVLIKGLGAQVHGSTNRGGCIVMQDVGTSILTTGQRVVIDDVHVASTGISEDGIWKNSTTKNVIDMVRCNNCQATGYFDSFAIFNTVRTVLSNNETVSTSNDSSGLPQGMQFSGNSLVNSNHLVQSNVIRVYQSSTGFGATAVGIKIPASIAGTKDNYVMVANNRLDITGELDSAGIGGLESKAYGILVNESGYALGTHYVQSSNNIFNVSGARLNYGIGAGDSAAVFSTNDRNTDGTALTNTTTGTGAITTVL